MPEYVYALNDYLENLDGEMSSHGEDQIEVVEKVDTAGTDVWWKSRTIEGRLGLVPQKINSPSKQLAPSIGGKKVSRFTMMDVQKAVEELRRLCAEDDNARCVSFASSDTETDPPDFASDVEEWCQATETTLAEYSDSGCVEKADLEAQTATRASSFVLPRPMSNFSASEVTRDTPGERIHSPARLSFPTSIYENIRLVPLSVSDQPTNGQTPLSGLSLHAATDPAVASSSEADGVLCALLNKTPSFLVTMHRPSIEDTNGKESGNERHPNDWTVAEVAEWLKSKGLDKAILDKFVEQEITGDVLLRLDSNMLKTEIGVSALGKRLRVASAITDLRQSSILSPPNSSITKTSLPPSSFRHASSSTSLDLLSRKQHHSQSCHSLPEVLDHHSSWSFPADFMFDGSSTEVGSSSTHGSGIGLEIPFSINEDVPMNFETSSSLSHGHSSVNRASGHHPASPRTKRHSRARYTLGGSKAGPGERLVPGGSSKRQKPLVAIETHMKRPLTFGLPKGINMTSATYFQRPSTSGGSPNEKEKASYVQRPSTSSGLQEKKSHGHLLKKERDSKAIRTASATYFRRPSTSSGSLKKESQSPIILRPLNGGEKGQGLPTASVTLRKRPSTFSLSGAYFQRPSTSSGAPKEPQSLFRDSKKEKGEKTWEENFSTHGGTLRKRMSILAWRSSGPSVEGKGPIGAKGGSFYEQIGVPDHTGWMRKRADRYHIWNLRYFVLKGQRLYWFKTDDRSEARPTGFVDVVGYRVTVDETLDTGRYGLRIDHDGEKTHFFSSDERTVIREWMKAILKATISRDQTKPVTSSASNIQTIPLTIAQAMHPRPPSPTARDATQKAHKRENPNQLSKRDARVLGFPSPMREQWVYIPESYVRQRPPRQPRKPFVLNPTNNDLVEWANSHLPARLQTHDATTFFGGLALLRLAESIKGEQASPPVPDSAFPSGPADDMPDGLFHLLDFLLGSGVKMGSVSINDIRLGRRDKILELLRSLKAWEENRGRGPLTIRA